MGGNTTNRKIWAEAEIMHLVNCYKQQDAQFYNPITDKVLSSERSWKNSISVKMDFNSANNFFFQLEKPHYSILSGIQLTIKEYKYNRKIKFKKYTAEEIKTRAYMQLREYKVSDETKDQISKTLKKYNQSDSGADHRKLKSKRMRSFYSTEAGKIHKHNSSSKASKTMKAKIARGEFTPPITNTWTHWKAEIILHDNITKKFRSSWEACFWFCNQHLEYETIRIKCADKVFINDFYDKEKNTMYELKPISRYNLEIEKMTVLINYCIARGIKFVWINEKNISNYIDPASISNNESAMKQFNKIKKCCNV